MTQGASRLPIVQVLNRLMDDYGFTPVELVHAIGYRHDVEKGLRRLNLWLENGEGYGRILEEISTVFPAYGDGKTVEISSRMRPVALGHSPATGYRHSLFQRRACTQWHGQAQRE